MFDHIQHIDAIMQTLSETYKGRGAIELGQPFRVLISTIISQRTREEQTTAVSMRVFDRFPDTAALAVADETELFHLLDGSQYADEKAPRLIQLAQILVAQHGGHVPDTFDALAALPGVGRKTANCVLIYAFQKDALCVDTHFHRIVNRLGWVATKTPDATEKAVADVLPCSWWQGSNRLFLQHGRAICGAGVPKCNRCPIRLGCAYGKDDTTPKR